VMSCSSSCEVLVALLDGISAMRIYCWKASCLVFDVCGSAYLDLIKAPSPQT
jgi:hypothetical protein